MNIIQNSFNYELRSSNENFKGFNYDNLVFIIVSCLCQPVGIT